jgi:hypothetical protein
MKSLMLVVLTLAGLSLLTGCACCGAKPLGSGAGAPARCACCDCDKCACTDCTCCTCEDCACGKS